MLESAGYSVRGSELKRGKEFHVKLGCECKIRNAGQGIPGDCRFGCKPPQTKRGGLFAFEVQEQVGDKNKLQ
jgi:hypothetical protein